MTVLGMQGGRGVGGGIRRARMRLLAAQAYGREGIAAAISRQRHAPPISGADA